MFILGISLQEKEVSLCSIDFCFIGIMYWVGCVIIRVTETSSYQDTTFKKNVTAGDDAYNLGFF